MKVEDIERRKQGRGWVAKLQVAGQEQRHRKVIQAMMQKLPVNTKTTKCYQPTDRQHIVRDLKTRKKRDKDRERYLNGNF